MCFRLEVRDVGGLFVLEKSTRFSISPWDWSSHSDLSVPVFRVRVPYVQRPCALVILGNGSCSSYRSMPTPSHRTLATVTISRWVFRTSSFALHPLSVSSLSSQCATSKGSDGVTWTIEVVLHVCYGRSHRYQPYDLCYSVHS